jgi:two-component system, cell cycle sensor histidine kinase and response regulator CckA
MGTILIVEDDQALRRALKEKLTLEGFNVLIAADGKKALEITASESVDLILLDIVMPNMDGISMFYHLNQTGNKNIPVIILTNLTTFAFPEGIKEVLIKAETSLEKIVEKIKGYLGEEK